MQGALREDSAQSTVEYAIVTLALLSIALAALVERAASHGIAPASIIDAATGAKDIALY